MSISVSNFLIIHHQIHYPFITASAPLIDEVFPDLFGVGALELDREECCVIRTKLTNVHGSLTQLMVMVIMMVIWSNARMHILIRTRARVSPQIIGYMIQHCIYTTQRDRQIG